MGEWKIWAFVWLLAIGMFVGGFCLGRIDFEPTPPCDCSDMRKEIVDSSTETCGILLKTVADLKKKELCPWESY